MKNRSATRVALAAAVVLALVAVPSAFAGKGGGKGGKPAPVVSGGLALVMVSDANANGVPNWGDTITFRITSTVTDPYVEVRCSQNGTVVYSAWAGFYDSYPWPGQRLMPLTSPSWLGGAADCTATLNSTAGSLKFHVDA